MFLIAPNFGSIPAIRHGFFTRKEGVSKGIYASLNCGAGSADDAALVTENRMRAAHAFGAAPDKLFSLYQVHGKSVITIDSSSDAADRPQADAMVTKTPGLMLGILTADCVPVLFADPQAGVIGAAHAGWKGAIGGVLQETIKAMCALGANISSLCAAIGPAIGRNSYEVNDLFRLNFIEKSAGNEIYFRNGIRDGHYFFDIKAYVAAILKAQGLLSINALENDTYIEEYDFFSYRRATHRAEPDYGRQLSAIMLKTGT